jgi:Ni/Co efflux regulator RcnB
MKTVFVANKSSYGAEFYEECTTLNKLKRAIVAHEHRWSKPEYTPDMYTEELFQTITDYTLYEVRLHDTEHIVWHEYDGQSWFSIEKKEVNLLSTIRTCTE